MPTTAAPVNGYYWNYTTIGGNASIGTGTTAGGNATTSGTDISGAIIIPSTLDGFNVTSINPYAFYLCASLTPVTIPDSVTYISTGAFRGTGLTSVNIPNSVTFIGDTAFFLCSSLTSVTIGTNIANIGSDVFTNCTSLVSINIPNSVTSIANNAFTNTSANLTVTINNNRTISTITFTSPTAPGPDITFFGNNSVTLVLPQQPQQPPTMTITATDSGSPLTSGSITNNATIALTFTSSASTSDFVVGDISLTNGTLSAFAGIGTEGTVYTATFTPSGQGVCTINVAANKFTSAGQTNTASDTFTWTFDALPSMIITSNVANNATTNVQPIELTFTSSEAITGFTKDDISFNNGTLGDLSGSGSVYTATLTQDVQGAYIINVPVGAYIDASGNANTAATTFNWTYDSLQPTMDISSTTLGVTTGSITNNANIALTFTSSKSTTNFVVGDISVTNGTLSNFASSSPTVYNATFTPTGQGACTIDVAGGAYTDAVGNSNVAATQFTWTFDAIPSMIITSTNVANNATTNVQPIELTFTSSEAITGFTKDDISFNNGTLGDLSGSGSVYTATLTQDVQGPYIINVPVGAYIDASGNSNTAATTFNWTYDSVQPTMDISAGFTTGSITNNATIALTFTSSKSTTNFVVGDISVTNGTLSNFASSSPTVYNATFTPTSPGPVACTIDVAGGAYTDSVGNSNIAATQFAFTFDALPSMIITSNVANNATTNVQPIELTFTATEAIFGFDAEDISFNNGTLSGFAGIGTDGAVYTATLTQDVQGAYIINVPVGAYTDASGNANTAATTFNWTYDSVQPTMDISATTLGVTSGSTINNSTIALTFTSSKATSNFVVGDISFTNGTLSAFAGSGTDGKVYTATFTPTSPGPVACTIDVAGGAYTDAVGNSNISATQFAFTYDGVLPTMEITSTTAGVTSGSTTINETIELTFTSSKSTTNFVVGDISVTNGSLSNFASSSPTVYTATFTPTGQGACTIGVASSVYTDSVGNNNTAATTFNWTFDTVSPNMIIASDDVTSGSTINKAITLKFTSSEATTNFAVGDISVTNGSLSAFASSSPTVYTALFTPTSQGVCTIDVAAGAYTDAATNLNNLATQFTWTYDSISPRMDIESTTIGVSSGSTTNVKPIELKFTSSEATTNFVVGDISVTNGSLSNFASSSPTVYTATFTPTGLGPFACTIDVLAGAYTDAATNLNNLATQFAFTYDGVLPTMDITSTTAGVTSGSTTNNETIALTFTSSKSTTNFVVGDISVTNGTLSAFASSSDTVYMATFTPAGQGACTIDVSGGVFTDALGNANAAATTFNWTFDTVSPNMTIATDDVTNGSTTNQAITLRFTSTEATTNFAVGDISVTNGSLSAFASSSPTVYTALFTPTSQGVCTINVAAGAYTDVATNLNNLATQFSFTYDSVVPTMLIESTTIGVSSGSTTNNASIVLRFTSTEATTNFVVGDISVTNGTLSNFASSSPTVYTATFTPTGQGACTIGVASGAYTDAAGNNNPAATTFNWTYDSVSPGMTITSTTPGVTSGSTTSNAFIALTFTSTAATTDFVVGDISVTNGTLSNFASSSPTVYTSIFTPTNQGLCTIDVSSNKFTYAAGNGNNATTQFTWTFDSVSPTMTITSTTAGVTSGSTIDNATIALTFTSSEATTNFAVGDISVTNGTLSNFAASSGTDGKVYTATFTPTRQGLCTIGVATGAYTDVAGNSNSATTFSVGYIPKFAEFNDANNLEQTYIAGFLDVSGNVNHRSGDLTSINGDVFVRTGNANFNSGNLYVGGNVSVNSNMAIAGITTVTSLVARDNLDVSGASALGGSLTVAGITSLNNHVTIANNKQFTVGTGKATFGGDVSLNSNLIVDNGASLKSSADVIGSAVFADTAVNGALLFNTRPSFASDISLNGQNVDILGNLYAQYAANSIPASAIIGGAGNVIDVDVSMNAGLNVVGATTLFALATSGDTTIGGTLNIIGASTMSTLSISNATTIGGPLNVIGITAFSNDVSFNGSRIDICGNLYAQYPDNSIPSSAIMGGGASTYNTDVSMNAGLFVSNAVALGSTLVVSGKTALLGDISLGTVNGSNIDICGNLFANYAPNSIPQSAIIGGVGSLFTSDVSMNAGLYVKDGITLDTITMQYQQTPDVGLYVNAELNTTTLFSSGNAILNSTVRVTGATTLSSTLNVTGAATLAGTMRVNGATTTDALTTTGATTVVGTLNVPAWSPFNAAVTLRSTLAVAGATTLNSTLTVTGATTMNSNLSVVGATTLNTTLTGIGSTTLAATTVVSTLNISGATTFGSTLAVTGATTLASLLTVAGTTRFKGDISMNSTLNVLGDVSLNSTLFVTAATTLPSLTVAGATTLGTTMRINQTAQFGLDAIAGNTLTVAGDVSMNARLSVSGATTLRSTLEVTGPITFAALTVPTNAIIGDQLTVSGATSFSQDASLNVTAVDISGVVNAGRLQMGVATLQYRPNIFQLGGDIDGEVTLDQSGYSVALSADGSVVAIGAHLNDGMVASSDRGHVRVYQRNVANTTIAPIGWTQLGGDIDGEAASDQSGFSVALSADGLIVAIGANQNDGTVASTTDNRGQIRVYQRDASNNSIAPIGWAKLGGDIDGEAATDNSGDSVAISSDGTNIIVAIGSNKNDGTAGSDRGKVRVYKYDINKSTAVTDQSLPTFGPVGWNRLGADIDGEAASDESGWSVSLSGNGSIVAIGAYFNDGTVASTSDNRGHVRVYQYQSGNNTWSQLGNDIDGELATDQSGYSVSLSADGLTVAIGANQNDGPNPGATSDNRGHVRVYKYELVQPNTWSQLGGDIDGEAANDQSGFSVFLSGDGYTVAIGAYFNDGTVASTINNRGHVRIYKYDPSKTTAVINQSLPNFGPVGWTRLGTDIDGELTNDQSGISLSLSADGSTVAIGANFNDGINPGTTGDNRGHVRVYQILPSLGLQIDASLNVPSIVTTGYASVGGNLSVAGATTMNKTLYVTGASTFATLSSVNSASIGGTLNVNGATTIGSTLQINGAATATSLTTNSNATVGGVLNVADATTMGSLNFTGQLLQW